MSKSPFTKGAGVFAGTLVQTAANTDTWVQIPTGIDPGSNTVIELESMEVLFRNAHSVIPLSGDANLFVGVSRSPVVPSLANTDCFGMCGLLAAFNTGSTNGVAVFDATQSIDLEPALTIQPYVYICVSTAALSAAASIDYRVSYSTKKASQAETLLLLASGA